MHLLLSVGNEEARGDLSARECGALHKKIFWVALWAGYFFKQVRPLR